MADYSMAAGGWAAAGSAVGNGIASYITASAQADVAEIQANSSNIIRAINNQTAQVVSKRNAVLTGLQRWAQGVRNDRVYESIGKSQEALAVNFNRSRDARTRANFAVNVRNAEEQGRMQAAAAASGITGSVVDVINTTNVLKQNMVRTATLDAERSINYDQQKREFDQRLALLDQLDNTLIFDNMERLDFGVTQPRQTTDPLAAAAAGVGVKGFQAIGSAVGNFFNFDTPKDALGFPVDQ